MMTETSRFLPPGWPLRVSAAVLAALVGNLAVHLIPWPQSLMVSLNQAQGAVFMNRSEFFYRLALTLVSAPLAEEAVFRWGIYGLLRKKLLPVLPALISALAFGLYHENIIQGLYAFGLGLVLAWGYEDSPWGKYRMAVLMHAAANAAALLVFG